MLAMADYIEREDAIKLIFEQFHMYFEVPCLPRDEAIQRQVCAVRDKINKIPAADVAPVRHGHWNAINQIATGLSWKYRCNDCGCPQKYTHNYCPNCGARMDEGAD